jgi:hypothetical protein
MCRRLLFRLWLALTVVLCVGSTSASIPAACTGAHCVYLPLVVTPELVTVSDVQLEGTRFEGVAISGEVLATTSTAVYSVTLEVRTYGRSGNLISTTTGRPALVATLPGQPNPFYFGTGATDEDDPARFDIRVSGFSRTHPRTFLPVTVNITSYEYVGGLILLSGTLTNESALPLENIVGVDWVEQGDQRLIETYAPQLAPFETVPFSTSLITCDQFCDIPIPYKIVAQGVVP